MLTQFVSVMMGTQARIVKYHVMGFVKARIHLDVIRISMMLFYMVAINMVDVAIKRKVKVN